MKKVTAQFRYENSDIKEILLGSGTNVPPGPMKFPRSVVRPRSLIAPVFFAVFLVLVILFSKTAPVVVGGLLWVGMFFFGLWTLAVIGMIVLRAIDRRQSSKLLVDGRNYLLTVDVDGVKCRRESDRVDTVFRWNEVTLVKETPNFYIVFEDTPQLYIPKRALNGQAPLLDEYLADYLAKAPADGSQKRTVYRYE